MNYIFAAIGLLVFVALLSLGGLLVGLVRDLAILAAVLLLVIGIVLAILEASRRVR